MILADKISKKSQYPTPKRLTLNTQQTFAKLFLYNFVGQLITTLIS